MIKEERIEALKSMHCLMMHMNNEEAYMSWINWFPDEPTQEDFEEIAEDDESFNDCTSAFERITESYIEDGYYFGMTDTSEETEIEKCFKKYKVEFITEETDDNFLFVTYKMTNSIDGKRYSFCRTFDLEKNPYAEENYDNWIFEDDIRYDPERLFSIPNLEDLPVEIRILISRYSKSTDSVVEIESLEELDRILTSEYDYEGSVLMFLRNLEVLTQKYKGYVIDWNMKDYLIEIGPDIFENFKQEVKA